MQTVRSITELIGNQTPRDFNGGDYSVYFMVPVIVNNIIDFKFQRVPIKSARNYYSIQEILENETLIPPNSKGYDIKTIQKHLAVDSRRGFGVEYPDYGIVAYSGKHSFDKPIASATEPNGTVKYFANPIISNLIKRI